MKLLVSLTLTLSLLVPTLVRAEHGPPTASTVEVRVAQYQADLDELAIEFGFEPGEITTFDEPRFNRLMGYARILLERARTSADRGDLCHSVRWLAYSVRFLDAATNFGINAGMPGFGFSDDLASLSEFRAETLLEDLIVIAGDDVPPFALTFALRMEEIGDADGNNEEGDWATAARAYAVGVCVLARFL